MKKFGVVLILIFLIISMLFLSGCDEENNEVQNSISMSENLDINSAYSIAQEMGYEGSLAEFIEDIKGNSAYEIAQAYGYEGTAEDWLNSLKGAQGKNGINGITPYIGENGNWFIGETDTNVYSKGDTPYIGENGNWFIGDCDTGKTALASNGKSAYEIAKGNGFSGTELEWIESLKGQNGLSITNIEIDDDKQLILSLSNGEIRNLGVVVGSSGKEGKGICATQINEEGQLVLEYTDNTKVNLGNVVGLNGTNGINGKELKLNVANGFIKWQYEGEDTWNDLVNLKDITGDKGENGEDGITPHIGEDNYWYIGEIKTEIIAKGIDGQNGITPHIGENGNWFIGNTDTNINAIAINGQNGVDGKNGITPHIGENGNWFIGNTDTNVRAIAKDGQDGQNGNGIESINKIENEPNSYEILFSDGTKFVFEIDCQAKDSFEVVFDSVNGLIDTCVFTEFNYNQTEDLYKVTKECGSCFENLPIPEKTGFTFLGWYTGTGINDTKFCNYQTISTNINLVAKWKENQYNIQFVDGKSEVMDSIENVKYTQTLQLPKNDFIRKNYVFVGWEYENDLYENEQVVTKLCAEDNGVVFLDAKWEAEKFQINYVLNGGINNQSNPDSYTILDNVNFEKPNKEGYTFLGWYLDSEYVDEITSINEGNTGNVEIFAKWEINQYTITFNTKGGNEILPITKDYNTLIEKPDNPIKAGDKFISWDNEIPDKMPCYNMTINAIWETYNYSITYHLFDGVENPNEKTSYTINDDTFVLELPSNISSEEFGFYNYQWYLDEEKSNEINKIEKGSVGDIDLYLGLVDIIEYKINYNLDNGQNNSNNPSSYNVLDEIVFKNPNKPGYTFGGWFEDELFNSSISKLEQGTIGNKNLYAKFDALKYTISFDTNGGNEINAITQEYNSIIKKPENPTKIGYNFVGWFPEIPEIMPNNSFTCVAQWEEIVVPTSYVRVNENNVEDDSGEYILFGEFPQTIKADDVSIVENTPNEMGYFLGSDNYQYKKIESSIGISNYNFSDGSLIENEKTYYFKVEPIKWRILKEDNGKAIILCESIILCDNFGDDSDSWEYSSIRSWLNDEFYNTVFDDLQKAIINSTLLDNKETACGGQLNQKAQLLNDTEDNVYLLSYQDIINTDYGFTSATTQSDNRIKALTDYARSLGGYMNTGTSYGNGNWLTRSPAIEQESNTISYVARNGKIINYCLANYEKYGIVPAITINL